MVQLKISLLSGKICGGMFDSASKREKGEEKDKKFLEVAFSIFKN
jgi:hypothetical protein